MSTSQIAWNEIRQMPLALRRSWRHHRKMGSPLADVVLVSHWRPGICANHRGAVMVSFTKFTPLHSGDLGDIWLAGIRLADQLTALNGSVGLSTWVRPGRRRELGSLSVWTDSGSLESFITLPDHIAIMNRYRERALPVRSATWWTQTHELDPHDAVSQGLLLLDTHDDQRVVLS